MKQNKLSASHKPFRAALNRLLDYNDHPTRMEEIAKALIKKARAGDTMAIKEIADRTDGKVPQSIGGDAELGPIGVVITGVIRADDEQIEQPEIKQLKLVNDSND